MLVTGRIISVEDKTVGQSELKLTQVVVQSENVNPDYPQQIPIDFIKDKIDLLEGFKVNDIVQVAVVFRGYLSKSGHRGVNLLGTSITNYSGQSKK